MNPFQLQLQFLPGGPLGTANIGRSTCPDPRAAFSPLKGEVKNLALKMVYYNILQRFPLLFLSLVVVFFLIRYCIQSRIN